MKKIILLCALFAAGISMSLAQSPSNASLIVTVEDPNSAVIPGATVSVINEATGEIRSGVTNGRGSVTFLALPLSGTYKVEAAATNFKTGSLSKVDLQAGEGASIRIRLDVA